VDEVKGLFRVFGPLALAAGKRQNRSALRSLKRLLESAEETPVRRYLLVTKGTGVIVAFRR